MDNSISQVSVYDTRVNHSYYNFLTVGGFCSYEKFISPDDRGIYNWSETAVEDQPVVRELNCFYGSQEENRIGVARRQCLSNNTWRHPSDTTRPYDGSQCITGSTAQLRMLRDVGLFSDHSTACSSGK